MTDQHLLETDELWKSYGDRVVVRGVSINVGRGEIVGLLGPNGAGKTTTFHMVVGLVRPDRGAVLFDGEPLTNMPMHRRSRLGIGYLCQDSSIFRGLTVAENIMAVLETLGLSRPERELRLQALLDELGLSELADNQASTLSGGERRRLEITRALVTHPHFLLLDEPFSGIDPIAVAEAQALIRDLRNRGLGILLTDHNVRETLAVTDRAYIMAEGEVLVSGSSEQLIQDPQARAIYLGERFTM